MTEVVSENMVDPAPPISQSMDTYNSSGRLSSDPQTSSPAKDVVDLSSATTPSPSKQLDPQAQSPSRVEEYRQLFRLPSDEVLIQDFNCAFQENFLLQGHMYVFVHFICFYSNLFGFETKKIIPFPEITSVRRAKAVSLFPTAIEIIAGEKKYFFTSFLFRDEAFKLINEGWQKCNESKGIITHQEETRTNIKSQENDYVVVEESSIVRESLDDLDAIESDKNELLKGESKRDCDGEPEIASTSQVREEMNGETAPSISSPPASSVWLPADIDVPGVPEGYTKVAESKFPMSVEDFFNMFFSDDGVNFHEAFHKKCGDKDFKCTPWRPHEKFGHSRDVSFQHPIKIYFGARFGSCREIQKYRVYRNCDNGSVDRLARSMSGFCSSYLVIDTSQDISDVPYADYFKVEGRWDVEEVGDSSKPCCLLRVYTNIAFSKNTMWKGKIVQSTVEECREAYAIWVNLAHEVLKQKNPKLEESVSSKVVQPEKHGISQLHAVSTSSDTRILPLIPAEVHTSREINDQPRKNAVAASVRSLLRETFSKFCSHLKNYSTPSLLLVIIVAAILVLMQISILVLLSRPHQVHVIPQADSMSSIPGSSGSRLEALDSVTNQIKHLKEELRFVETLLQRMQNEHARLQENVKKLELFRDQWI